MWKHVSTAWLLMIPMCAQQIDRTKPPTTPPLPDYQLPPVFESKLPNGLSLVLVEDKRFALVTARLTFQAGSKFDPNERPGLSEAVGALLTEGTKTRTSRQIAEEVASIGGSLNARSDPDALIIGGGALSEHLARLLDLMADVARNAAFPENEVQLYKQNRLQSLRAQRSEAAFLAEEKYAAVVFGAHPYSHISPTPASIERLDVTALKRFRDQRLTPNNAVLILLGRLPARAELLKLIASKFGSWQQQPLGAAPPSEIQRTKGQLVLVNRAGSVQADIRLGNIAVTRTDPDYFPLIVGNTILGGGTSSRLFNNIREKQGYAYDVHSIVDPHRDAGVFTAVTQVRNEVVEPAMRSLMDELSRMGKEPVSAAELADVKNYLNGRFLIRLQTQESLADQLSGLTAVGLSHHYLETYVSRVRSVEPDQIQSAARKYVSPENANIVVVGDAEKIGKAIEKFGKVRVMDAE